MLCQYVGVLVTFGRVRSRQSQGNDQDKGRAEGDKQSDSCISLPSSTLLLTSLNTSVLSASLEHGVHGKSASHFGQIVERFEGFGTHNRIYLIAGMLPMSVSLVWTA